MNSMVTLAHMRGKLFVALCLVDWLLVKETIMAIGWYSEYTGLKNTPIATQSFVTLRTQLTTE